MNIAHPVNIAHRVGISPADRCTGQSSCPDVLRLDTGDYLVIGRIATVTDISGPDLTAHGASIGEDEQAIVVPADVLHAAARDIAKEQQ